MAVEEAVVELGERVGWVAPVVRAVWTVGEAQRVGMVERESSARWRSAVGNQATPRWERRWHRCSRPQVMVAG